MCCLPELRAACSIRQRIAGGERHRLLADDMLAVPERRDRRLDMHVMGRAIVEDLDLRIFDQFLPAGVVAVVPVATGGVRHALLGPAGDGPKVWPGRRGPEDVGHRLVGIAVGLGHEPIPEETHIDGPFIGIGGDPGETTLAHRVLGPSTRVWLSTIGNDTGSPVRDDS